MDGCCREEFVLKLLLAAVGVAGAVDTATEAGTIDALTVTFFLYLFVTVGACFAGWSVEAVLPPPHFPLWLLVARGDGWAAACDADAVAVDATRRGLFVVLRAVCGATFPGGWRGVGLLSTRDPFPLPVVVVGSGTDGCTVFAVDGFTFDVAAKEPWWSGFC